MSARVLLIDPDDTSRVPLTLALGKAGLTVVPLADTTTALDVLDAAPGGVHLAVVSLRQAPGKPHGIAFALMMRSRDEAARIVLLVDRPRDLKAVDRSDACAFVGTLVQDSDKAVLATEIVRRLE
jgi:hypothetical protein